MGRRGRLQPVLIEKQRADSALPPSLLLGQELVWRELPGIIWGSHGQVLVQSRWDPWVEPWSGWVPASLLDCQGSSIALQRVHVYLPPLLSRIHGDIPCLRSLDDPCASNAPFLLLIPAWNVPVLCFSSS